MQNVIYTEIKSKSIVIVTFFWNYAVIAIEFIKNISIPFNFSVHVYCLNVNS